MMRRAIAVSVLILIAAAAAFANDQHCKADPKECEKQIRAFLAEKRYLGVTLRLTRWGVVIKSVAPASPAEKGGLLAGDRIIGVNGVDSTDVDMAEIKKRLLPPGKDANLTLMVSRLGDPVRVQVKLSVMPEEQITEIVEAHLARSHADPVDDNN